MDGCFISKNCLCYSSHCIFRRVCKIAKSDC